MSEYDAAEWSHEKWRIRERAAGRAKVLRNIAALIPLAVDAGLVGAAKHLESAADAATEDIASRTLDELEEVRARQQTTDAETEGS